MDQERFDQLAVSMAQDANRRTLLQLLTGALVGTALLATPEAAGKGQGKDKGQHHGKGRAAPQRAGADATSCAQQCRKKTSKAARRRCRKRCTPPIPACTTSQDCPPGELCESGVCIPIPDQCQTDRDCDECERCDGGTCVARCLPPQHCQNGQCIGGGGEGGTCVGCTPPDICGGGNPGTPGVCGCTATTCAAQGKNCGTISDGCSSTLDCGTCTVAGGSCGGGGVPNVCGNARGTCAAGADICSSTGDWEACNANTNCFCQLLFTGETACVHFANITGCGTCTSSAQCGPGEVCVVKSSEDGACASCAVGQGRCRTICPAAG